MNSGIIGATVYAYKHKDYGDVFLYLKKTDKYDYFKVTDKASYAIFNYHSNSEQFEEMFKELQEDYVYAEVYKDYTDDEGYTGTLKKSVPLQIKDFVQVPFHASYNTDCGWI